MAKVPGYWWEFIYLFVYLMLAFKIGAENNGGNVHKYQECLFLSESVALVFLHIYRNFERKLD